MLKGLKKDGEKIKKKMSEQNGNINKEIEKSIKKQKRNSAIDKYNN